MRSIEHRFDLLPTLEVTVSTMTLNRAAVSRTAGSRTAVNRATGSPSSTANRVTSSSKVGSALRLTRRGRAALTVAGVLVLIVAAVAVVLLVGGTAAAGRDARPLPTRYHVVLPGETLWQIAAEVDTSGDPRDTVARIRELNHLQSASLSAGTRLVLPVVG
jgi:LysM repeat protein